MMKERVQDMGVINAARLARENGYDPASGEDAAACVETAGLSGIDTGVCGAEVGIRRRDCCGRTSDTVEGADPCVERHTVLAAKTGGVGDEAGLSVQIQDTKPLGRRPFCLDLDNESSKPVNLDATEH